ncbi:MAG: transporter permease protein [Symbiobacteriaceae bacterium]|jgi:peptide/nickel transport system permease protein|nr:transporter permease protein [Symbiobacteriaceae bacterium]
MRRPRRAYLIAGGLLIGLIFLMMIFADQLTTVSPLYRDAHSSILDGVPPFAPDKSHWLGTDLAGRDVWSRIAYGARWSMLFAFLIMAARLAVAIPAAFLSAFGPKRAGWAVDRLYVMTSAIPPLVIYILLLSSQRLRLIGLWPSVVLTVSLLTLMEWPRVAVVLKGRVASLMAEPFIEGAIAVGNSRWQLFRGHLFPHLWPVILQLAAAEMARALVVIAQLALFGILVGGGVITIMMDARGNDTYVVSSGIPEWGTLLGEGRYEVLAHPWIAFSPAVAFLIGITGFSLLSQGLETITITVQEIKEATTAKLSRKWRWAIPALAACALLWYYQGLPWGRQAAIEALAARQAAALNAGDLDAYASTIRSDLPGAREDLLRWAGAIVADGAEVEVGVHHLTGKGSKAKATWEIRVRRPGQSTEGNSRETVLVRHWGRWYDAGEAFAQLEGFSVDVTAVFNPVDPTAQAIPLRDMVTFLSSAADNAFAEVEPLFPAAPGAPRPQLKLYPTINAWTWASGGSKEVISSGIWYTSGEPIRVSPAFIRGIKRWDVERSLAYEFMKYLAETRLGQTQVSPLLLGGWDLHQDPGMSSYRIDVSRLAGNAIFTLDELYAITSQKLTQERQFLYATQAGLLAEYAEKHLPERPIPSLTIAQLAERLGTAPGALGESYRAYVLERIMSESLLMIPAARPRIPAGLAEAVEARGEAVADGDEAGFGAMADPVGLTSQVDWFKRLRQAGVTKYTTTFLDFAETRDKDKTVTYTVPVLEQVTFADGRQVAGVVIQRWMSVSGEWIILGAPATLVP